MVGTATITNGHYVVQIVNALEIGSRAVLRENSSVVNLAIQSCVIRRHSSYCAGIGSGSAIAGIAKVANIVIEDDNLTSDVFSAAAIGSGYGGESDVSSVGS
jgi:hypothetical protein